MSVIRASDIGSYLYCRRAWRYRKDGVELENKAELAAGDGIASSARTQDFIRVFDCGTVWHDLLLVAILTLVAYCTAQL